MSAAPGAGSLVFVADVHLDASAPSRTAAFLDLLARLASPPRPAALYILGDLFDVWLGPASLADPVHRPILGGLRALGAAGVPVTVLQGNRDYLLDGRFASEAGVELVPEWLTLQLGSRRALLCHGDRLVLHDRPHQRLRAILRSGPARAIARSLPAPAVRRAARWLRRKSEAAGARRRAGGVRIPPEAPGRLFLGGYDVVIAGHVHEERRRTMRIEGRTCEFYTLGAWEDRGSTLVFQSGGLRFVPFPFGEAAAGAPSRSAPSNGSACPPGSS